MKRFSQLKTRFFRSEDGPTTTEYAMLLGVISLTVIGAMSMFGDHMNNIYVMLNSTLSVF
ncbi:MAG: Flp family type IVb pilin [Candidatus Krumholzibacteria bacterium]